MTKLNLKKLGATRWRKLVYKSSSLAQAFACARKDWHVLQNYNDKKVVVFFINKIYIAL
jgi:hypothetical protein